jgi:hypothetical protein
VLYPFSLYLYLLLLDKNSLKTSREAAAAAVSCSNRQAQTFGLDITD